MYQSEKSFRQRIQDEEYKYNFMNLRAVGLGSVRMADVLGKNTLICEDRIKLTFVDFYLVISFHEIIILITYITLPQFAFP